MKAVLLLLATALSEPAAPNQAMESPVAVPQPSAKAMDFYRSGIWLWCISRTTLILVPALILLSGTSVALRNGAQRITRNWWLSVSLFAVMYVLVNAVLTLPLDYYAGFIRPAKYGLAAQGRTVWHWLADELKALGITCGLAFIGLWMPYLAVRKLPRHWPWVVAAGSLPLAIVLMLLDPIVIDPMFNKFGPMRNQALESKILDLAARSGIEGSRVFEVDKSTQTTAINAYVKGIAGTHRIVLWDTLANKLNERQVLFVMGHEMGHYVLGHVTQSLLLGVIGVLIVSLFLKASGSFIIAKWGTRLGITRLDDIASLPLALVLGNAFVLAFSPIGLAYSRYQEHEADRFALELTRDNRAGAEAFVAMQGENLSNPNPEWLSVAWRSTHPTLAERITFCNTYHPWTNGEHGRYEAQFRRPESFAPE